MSLQSQAPAHSARFIVIAIDGGAASGKSSTSRALADQCHLMHVDTGAHYRAITWCLLQASIAHTDVVAIEGFLKTMRLSTEVSGNRALIRINGYLPHETELKSPAVTAHVSHYSAVPAIRQALLRYQRDEVEVAKTHHFNGLIMEGRDIGSVVLPDAPYQFFLHADVATRQARRNQEGLSDTIAMRDHIDSTRIVAPLKCPENALCIDTSELPMQAVIQRILDALPSGLASK